MSQAVERIVVYFETLTPASLERLADIYTDDATFKDPFHEVRGVEAIGRIFRHMYASLHEPRFVVTGRVADGGHVFLTWDFRFRFRSHDTQAPQVIRGASELHLAADGRIRAHRDYWDAAEELYEKLPVVGALMRWIRRRASR
jgi:ketosteroid isomerase-like protein